MVLDWAGARPDIFSIFPNSLNQFQYFPNLITASHKYTTAYTIHVKGWSFQSTGMRAGQTMQGGDREARGGIGIFLKAPVTVSP